MAVVHESGSITDAEHERQLLRAGLAATIGTAIEWYDFFLYSTVTGLVFARLYFPRADPLVGTLEAFVVYAIGLSRGLLVRASSATMVTVSGGRRAWSQLCRSWAVPRFS